MRFHTNRISPRTLRTFCDLLNRNHFNLQRYQAANPDLTPLGDSLEEYARHFIAYGALEGRTLKFDCNIDDVARFATHIDSLSRRNKLFFLRSLVASCTENIGNLLDAAPEQLFGLMDLKRFGLHLYLVVGDSHSDAYALPYFFTRGFLPLHLYCAGASARGLNNPNSQGRYGEKIHRAFTYLNKHLTKPCTAIFCFGQVDIEFVVYYKTIEDNSAAFISRSATNEFALQTISKYSSFFLSVNQYRMIEPCIATIFPPCLYDDTIRAGYINGALASLNSELSIEQLISGIRKFNFPNFEDRTKIHDNMNILLRNMSKEYSFPVLDVGSKLRGPNGLVNEQYMKEPKGTDHHLQFNSFNQILLSKIERVVNVRGRDYPSWKPPFITRVTDKARFLYEYISG